MQETIKRKLTAILSADVAGYSRLMDDDEVSTVRTLQAYQKIISDLTEQHNGRVVDSPGDNIMAEFASVVDAVQCAVEIQKILKSKNDEFHEDRKMQFRIGINLGDVIEEGDRIYGDGLNIAARVESFADAGGICISGRAYDQVENKLDFEYEYIGEKTAKNIKKPIRIYKIPIIFGTEKESEESILDSNIDMSVPTDKPSIAVLPFVNMSGDPDQEYFSDGMTEEIITALSKVPDIHVIARNSTFTYKNTPVNVKQVSKELGVKYILEGSVRKAGNRIRVTAQLIDSDTGKHLWADRYDRKIKDIFDLQDEITTRILEELSVKLYYEMEARFDIKRTNSLEAYLKYWQGIGYFSRLNKNDNSIARKLFMEVIELDPNWGLGLASLCYVNLMDFFYEWSSQPDKCLQEAIEYAQKSVSIDNAVPGPYVVFSFVNLLKKKYDEAINEAENAVKMQPGYPIGHAVLGIALLYSGNPQKAKEIFKKAISLNPKQSLLHIFLGAAYFCLSQYDESIRLFKLAAQKFPDYLFVQVYLSASYIMLEMEAKAKKQAQEILRIEPKFSVDNFVSRFPYKKQSDTDRILNALKKAGLK